MKSEQDGTLLFAYGNNPEIKKSRTTAGGKVNLLNNRTMRNGRDRFKICVKGYLYGDAVRDASYSHKISKDEEDVVSLEILMSKLQACKRDSEFIIFMQNVMFHTLALTVDTDIVIHIFIQLEVATGELDIAMLNGVI